MSFPGEGKRLGSGRPHNKKRNFYINIASHTHQACVEGEYRIGKKVIDLSDYLIKMRTVLYRLDHIHPNPNDDARIYDTVFTVMRCSTLEAFYSQANIGKEDILILNFASGTKPGGGFATGANAQEESLVRSSALYHSIEQCGEMYEFNKTCETGLYSDYMVYSKDVPVFKWDDGIPVCRILPTETGVKYTPYVASFITAPAANLWLIGKNEEDLSDDVINKVMYERIRKILSVAHQQGHTNLILGAFGCGVYKNDPTTIAEIFYGLLKKEYKNVFSSVVFAIIGGKNSEEIISPFQFLFS